MPEAPPITGGEVPRACKILHVLNHSLPQTDGYCVRSANIVKFQRELGWQPLVVTSPKHEPAPGGAVETFDEVRYFRTKPTRVSLPVASELASIRSTQKRIEEIVRSEQPDVVHAHSPCTWGLAASRAARRCNKPFVYEVRGIWEDGAVDQGRLKATSLQYRVRRGLETLVARRADAFVAISAGLQREFASRGAQCVFCVPNGVDLVKFSGGCGGDHSSPDHPPTISYIGSLYPWEGVEDLVAAAPLIRESEPRVQVRIVGDGETSRAIGELIDRLSLSDTVKMLGRVPHDQIANLYDSTDILVYPRRRSRTTELVTPLKPLEAMALEKAIVISNVGGLLELFDQRSALVFEAGDPRDLAKQCVRLLASKPLRRELGTHALQCVRRQRNWQSVVETYRDVYSHAIESWRRR